ncbi:GNAT family N-acetyltransferase [Alkalicoccus urumqiensis]|uniref:RimJ/RimL family protein N-acetyltransferase n=1 Tax=Alkalicoccus urumqiensis TaxID=1548213 RepID=A0A2P6MLU1_ALKUR|nr:GNAT family protein [Alkalicoccus urumqiensis]PRO67267.1 RimJ/RimL family protein N-acetyltransferase [Alkalicoccus urumqiensis]
MFSHSITQDIDLSLLLPKDADALFALTDRSRSHLRRFLPWVDAVQSPEHSASFIQAGLNQLQQNNGFQLGIWHQGALAGVIGLHYINHANRSTSIGYWLGDGFEGNGLITESCRALIDYMRREFRINRIEIRCAVENERSRAVPERLGMTHEGRIRQAEWLYDHFVDHDIYASVAEEDSPSV